jgi:hypothetical protein
MSERLDPRVKDALIAADGAVMPDRHRKEIEAMINKQVAALERERRIMRPMFIYLTIFCAALMVIGGYSDDPGRRAWFGIQACFWFVFGAMILLRYHINRVRVETMAELKQIQIELARLTDRKQSG